MNNRTLFIATMRKPEMRLVRQALAHLKECGDDWQAITELETCSYADGTCWFLATEKRMVISLRADDPRHTWDDFFSFLLHNANDPFCDCEDCQNSRLCYIRCKAAYIDEPHPTLDTLTA